MCFPCCFVQNRDCTPISIIVPKCPLSFLPNLNIIRVSECRQLTSQSVSQILLNNCIYRKLKKTLTFGLILSRKQCGPVVRALALRPGDPGFKTRFDHWLNLFLVVPGSTSRLHLSIANWFAFGKLGFLTVVVECSVQS